MGDKISKCSDLTQTWHKLHIWILTVFESMWRKSKVADFLVVKMITWLMKLTQNLGIRAKKKFKYVPIEINSRRAPFI